MIFYDFEVFKEDWLAVFIDTSTRDSVTICNAPDELASYYEEHKKDIFVGYNNLHYDQYIFKAILLGIDPKTVNDKIILEGLDGWQISGAFKEIPMLNYDVMSIMDGGLKSLEGMMGNDVEETDVDFNINRKLTPDELRLTEKYCIHDVEQTIEVFSQRINDFNATLGLIKTFKLPLSCIGMSHAQLSARILGCYRVKRDDEFDYMDAVPKTINLGKYSRVKDWFNSVSEELKTCEDLEEFEKLEKTFYSKKLKINIMNVPHVFGWGGLHGAIEGPVHRTGLILHVDVTSYYPSLMIQHGLLTRNSSTPEKYKEIFDTRVALKKAGKKKEQAPYKIVLNGTFGICKDKGSQAYDPRNANAICVAGQLMLLDLLDKLEGHCELIQSNTDGIILQIPDTDEAFEKIDDICHEWEVRNRMKLEFDIIKEIYQGDVNNYVFITEDNKIERKGAYVKELNDLTMDLAIVNEAIVKRLTEKIPVEKTIYECNDLWKFQKIFKLSRKYSEAWHNGRFKTQRCYRVFASRDNRDTYLGKRKGYGKTIEKFANSPEHCFVVNEEVKGKECPAKLDKAWYIALAKKRLNEKFGVI